MIFKNKKGLEHCLFNILTFVPNVINFMSQKKIFAREEDIESIGRELMNIVEETIANVGNITSQSTHFVMQTL